MTGKDHLDSNQPIKAFLPGTVHDAHSATTDLAKQLVTPEVDGPLGRARRSAGGLAPGPAARQLLVSSRLMNLCFGSLLGRLGNELVDRFKAIQSASKLGMFSQQ